MRNFSIDIKRTDRKKTISFQVERGLVKVLVPKHLDKIKLDIEELKNRKTESNDSVGSNERILNQIKVLSEMKKDGILTNSEFNDKKKLLLDKLK